MKKIKNSMVYYSVMCVNWAECPYCKKLMMFAPKLDIEVLKKWKKQKINPKTRKKR